MRLLFYKNNLQSMNRHQSPKMPQSLSDVKKTILSNFETHYQTQKIIMSLKYELHSMAILFCKIISITVIVCET